MRKVFRYSLPWTDEFTLSLPIRAELLSVQLRDDALEMWALVDDDNDVEDRCFRIAGTGHPIHQEHLAHIDTVQLYANDRPLVFHVFEVLGAPS